MADIKTQITKTPILWIASSVSILVAAICLVSWITVMNGFNQLELFTTRTGISIF